MPITSPQNTIFESPGNSSFSVSVPSGSATVTFTSDFGGEVVLAVVTGGSSATFSAPQGYFFYSSAPQQSSFSVTPIVPLQAHNPIQGANFLSNSTLGQNTAYFVPFDLQQTMALSRINFFVSVATAFSASNQTGSGGVYINAGLYSKVGSNSDIISNFWSGSQGIGFSCSSNTAYTLTTPLGTTALATSNATTYLATSVGGFRELPINYTTTLQPGRYWMAAYYSSVNADTSNALNLSIGQVTQANQINYQPWGHASAASNSGGPSFQELLGTYSATISAFPATIAVSSSPILGSPTGTIPYFNFSAFPSNASEG